ncbi:MAG TPA: hypothetical protein V6D46_03460 [Coleofasciculaceae cyanobacterium]
MTTWPAATSRKDRARSAVAIPKQGSRSLLTVAPVGSIAPLSQRRLRRSGMVKDRMSRSFTQGGLQ